VPLQVVTGILNAIHVSERQGVLARTGGVVPINEIVGAVSSGDDASSTCSRVLHGKAARAPGVVALKYCTAHYIGGIACLGTIGLNVDLETSGPLQLSQMDLEAAREFRIAFDPDEHAIVTWEA